MTSKNYPKVFFLLIEKLIDQYQRKCPSILAKYEIGMYQQGSSCGGINIYIKLITCEDNIAILPIIQSYVLYW